MEGGYIVTNAHVVWPYDTARVVFPNGAEFIGAPVKGWDFIADLAVIGPIEAPADALALVDGESLPIGTDMYLIGYPGEVEAFPRPTLVRGVLSRFREWEQVGITYLQTDATIAGGQSGGALVSDMGEAIGISGFGFTEGNFGVVASAADIVSRVRRLIASEDSSGLGERRVQLEGGELRHDFALANFWDERIYVINEPPGTTVELQLTGSNDGALAVNDSYGAEWLYVDDGYTGVESGLFVTEYDEPYFLIASQGSESSGRFELTSNRRLVSLHDPDDGQQIQVGQSVPGNIDFPSDVDHFVVHLEKGQTIEVTARSALADTLLMIDYQGASDEQIIIDDDSGGGLFGLDSAIVYRAPHAGTYFVVVEDVYYQAPGGYVLTVSEASPDAVLTTTTREALLGDVP